jgi:phosphomannomutase/phosphoglucomutase
MSFPEHVFRQYDIRGKVGPEDINPDFVRQVAAAYATRFAGKPNATLGVGRDLRATSTELSQAAVEGILSTGVNVVDVGQTPTPVLYFAIGHLGLDGGLGITASHRPADENGIKVRMGDGPFYGDDLQELKREVMAGEFARGSGKCEKLDVYPEYFRLASQQLSIARPMKVVLDVGNGCGTLTAPRLLRDLGCELTVLFEEPDGTFPGRGPDPTKEGAMEPLAARVREIGAELGIAIDADGDRVAVVDHAGEYVQPDQYMIPICRELLAAGPVTVVSEVRCSQSIVDDVESRGGSMYLEACGYPFILAGMAEHGAEIGFETTGHCYFRNPHFKFDDATFGAGKLLGALSRSDRSLREIVDDAPRYYPADPPRYACPNDLKFQVVEELGQSYGPGVRLIRTDGVRAQFPEGWSVIRASNTGEELVSRWEGNSPEARDRIGKDLMDRLRSVLGRHGLELREADH